MKCIMEQVQSTKAHKEVCEKTHRCLLLPIKSFSAAGKFMEDFNNFISIVMHVKNYEGSDVEYQHGS